jgi:hypothetical protein
LFWVCVSGALLTRLKADFEDDMFEVNHTHVYWNPHVDKANIASYDYSALLYLNTHGTDFDGGHFTFIDPNEDQLVRSHEQNSYVCCVRYCAKS